MCIEILRRIKEYCKKYDVALKYLVDVISDLKVIPMIRGKSFEYSVSDRLRAILSNSWEVKNLNINAQPGNHDIDVSVIRKTDKKEIRIECKLTKNNSFRLKKDHAELRVKCMRSRTFSDNAAAARMARHYGVSKEFLLVHADSYREGDFDYVITSLGNSMWTTIEDKYTFNGNREQFNYLNKLFPDHFTDFDKFQEQAFNFLLFAKSSDLIVSPKNKLVCTRRKCILVNSQNDCGFIPNYPIVNLTEVAKGTSSWKRIGIIEDCFNNFLA